MAGVKLEKIEDEKVVEQPKAVENSPVKKAPDDAMIGFYPIKDLPSRYKLYPEGTMIYGRPLRVLEVKQLAQMGEQNSSQVITNILKSATRGLKVEELLIADKIYILFWLRANTYKDSGYRVDFRCLKCGKDATYAFSLDSLDVTYLEDEVGITELELPIKKDKLVLRYQRVCDAGEVEDLKIKNLGNPLVELEDEILNLASSVVSINGKEMPLQQKYNYLISLDAGDYAALENSTLLKDIGVSTLIKVKCSICGEMTYAGLSFRPDFFIPKYQT